MGSFLLHRWITLIALLSNSLIFVVVFGRNKRLCASTTVANVKDLY